MPDKPAQSYSGKRGEAVTEVWQAYDWRIVDDQKYICIER